MPMTPAIEQRVLFHATPKELFEMYMDSRLHSQATSAPARISRKIRGPWQAHGGQIGGTNLLIVPGKMIVQAWRAGFWEKEELSILVLKFSKARGGACVDLVHAGVPAHDYRGVREGWVKYYWKPWKKYLSERNRKRRR
jgi:uncharacterized protein YndB with AHSA1/START domain